MQVSRADQSARVESPQLSRRTFMGSVTRGSLAATGLLGSTFAASSGGAKVKLGLIGCGWYGMVDVKAAFKVGGVEIVALCDVDSEHLKEAADQVEQQQGKRPRTFKHYEQLLALPDLEAVIIATPPHWHALPFIAALKRGLDIYCEKPLAYDIREGQAMVKAANESDQIVQIGFQRRQSGAIRAARDYIQQGNIGRVIHVDVQIHYTAGVKDNTPQDPPASLDWDLWCGPAPKLPYSPQVGHKSWRLEKAYGNGHLVDWGIHLIDATRWILDETMPRAVQASGGLYYLKNRITTPDILTAHMDFATCPVTWRHRLWGAQEYTPDTSNGMFFYGEKATVFATDRRWVIIPKGKGAERQAQEVKTDMGTKHMADFLEALRTRKQPSCSPLQGYYSTSTVQLAMIAYEAGQRIEWDSKTRQIVGNARAAQGLKRPYRGPWVHPYHG